MKAYEKRVLLIAIKKRLRDGETFEEIMNSYPKLTYQEKKELKQALIDDGTLEK